MSDNSVMSDAVYTDIKNSYLKQVLVPHTPLAIQYLLCPIGIVGAGKTTVVRPLSEKLSLVRISSDEIRKLFKEAGYGYERVAELAFELVWYFIFAGHSVCIDSDCASKIDQITHEAQIKKLTVIWIHINPPEEFILHKLNNLSPNWLGTAEEMVANYYERKPLHEGLPPLDVTVTFDTSQPDLPAQIAAAVPIIEQAVGLPTEPR